MLSLPHLLSFVAATLCVLASQCDAAHGTSGPRWLNELPARLLFSNWTGATVRCLAEGEPRPDVWWVSAADGLNASALPVASRAQLLTVHDGTLTFLPFREHQFREGLHRGSFRCRAHNSRGTVLSTVVHVNAVVAQDWELRMWSAPGSVPRGGALLVRCPVPSHVSHHVIVTAWEEEHHSPALITPRSPTDRYVMTSSGDLYVRSLTQAARFRCHTEDMLTRRNRTSSTYAHYHATETTGSQTPSITFHSGHVTVDQGRPTDLVCLAQGWPPPKFKWYRKQGQRLAPVSSSPAPTVLDGVLHWSGGVQTEDEGQYVCVASNTLGEVRATLQLSVIGDLSVSIRPRLVRAEAGDSVSFQCNATSSEASLEWRLNGSPLPLGFQRLERGFVRIAAVARHQGGMLQCFATSRDGRKAAQATAELVVGERAPRLERTYGTSGSLSPKSPASLGCRASGDPAPTITWTLDGAWPVSGSGPRLRLWSTSDSATGDAVSFLNWTSVETSDSGNYQCVASNAAGRAVHDFRLDVRGPLFTRPAYNITALDGHRAVLRCPFGGYPYDKITWFKDGSELPVNQRQTVFPNGTLLLETLTKAKDSGEYSCSVDSPAGPAVQQAIRVIVRTGPQITPFRWLDELQEGMRAGLSCFVHAGEPPIVIEWLKDGAPFTKAVRQDGFMSTISMDALTPQDNGNYTCRASNAWATASHSTVLRVKVAPSWRSEPKDVVAVTGHSVVVDCQAEGEPPPHIRWKTASGWDGGPYRALVSTSRVHVLVNGSLSVRSLETGDAGLYLCEASNGVGAEISKVVRLTVRSSPRLSPKESTTSAKRGSTVHLQCEPEAGDTPMRLWWHKDGVPVAALGDHRYTQTEHTDVKRPKSTLTITNVQKSDDAVFTCHASNDYGEDTNNVQLTVQDVPSVPESLQVSEASSRYVRLTWTEPFNGNLPISQYLLRWTNKEGTWEDSVAVSGTETKVTVRGLVPAASYLFTVRAENALGPGGYTSPLEVHTDDEPPRNAPTSVHLTPIDSRSIAIKFEDVLSSPGQSGPGGSNRVDGYYVAYRREGSPEPLRYQTLHEREGVLTGLDRDTRYEVLVQAYNSKGPGPPSRTHSVRTLVADPPPPPTYRVVGTSARTISLAWERPVIAFDDPPIRTYYVSWRVEGDEHPWREQSVGGDRTNFALSGLACGTRYQLRMRSASDVGRGPEGNMVTASTEGNRPVLQQPDRLVDSNSSAAWLHPEAWWHGGCPISHFTVHYRRSTEADWTLVSSHLPYRLTDEPLVLADLEPGSWYVLLMVAHNDAGSTTAQVNFATLTLSGDVPSQKPHLLDAKMASFYRHLTVTLPIGSSVLVLVVVLAVLWCVLRRHAEDAAVAHGTPQGSMSGERYKSEVLSSVEPTYCGGNGGSSRGSSAYAVPHRVYDVPYAHKRPGEHIAIQSRKSQTATGLSRDGSELFYVSSKCKAFDEDDMHRL
ncbi:Down syndrome cell adhesion molecule homolog [Rhipicephalus sanguineus]|uniref:Down syndrome cell adhesion molecule homolog n=1 Tax=Rhipicephalus sanguineus TaxID=34632 RepID=UPI001893FA89|nr:Down syndrome cell adhesion molecule homolog [Rhipicephalus sanguineus]